MGFFGRAFGVLVAGTLVASVIAAIAAVVMKGKLPRVDEPEADEVHLVAIFEPISYTSRASAFRGGTFDAWYGGGAIDLRDATLDPAGATLQVRTIFGGAQVVVPDSWEVTNRAVSIFGGVGDTRKSSDRQADAPHLTIEGLALFGGLGITSEVSDEQMRELREALANS
jgi:predicted membrane protein